MAKRLETRSKGTGITRHQSSVTVLDLRQGLTPGEGDELIASIAAAGSRPLWDNEQIVSELEISLAELKRHLPADHQDFAFRPHEDLGWYYSRLIMLDSWVKRNIAEGDAAMAAYNAAEFGSLFTELQIKKVWESDALSGRQSIKGARAGGLAPREKSEKVAARQQPLIDAYWRSRKLGGSHETAMDRAVTATSYSRRQAQRVLRALK